MSGVNRGSRKHRAVPAGALRGPGLEVLLRENGWSLFGLAQALRAQRKTTEATLVEQRFRQAWRGAHVTLTASRF